MAIVPVGREGTGGHHCRQLPVHYRRYDPRALVTNLYGACRGGNSKRNGHNECTNAYNTNYTNDADYAKDSRQGNNSVHATTVGQENCQAATGTEEEEELDGQRRLCARATR